VVTLEPCTHQGKQPPCTEAILQAGIRRVVYALGDRNPPAAGGAARLAASGVEVEGGLLAEEAQAQNAAFLHLMSGSARPYVALKLATSFDGCIADRTGRSRWISGSVARDYVHWLRAGFDAIGVGGYTARTDNAALTVRGAVEPRVPPLRVIFDRSASLPDSMTLVRTAREVPSLLIAAPDAPSARVTVLERAGVEVVRVAGLAVGLEMLKGRGVRSILIEGGGRLAGSLLSEGLVDRFYWIQAPTWLGDGGVPAFSGAAPHSVVEAERWRVVERRALGEDTLLVMDCGPCSPAS
jgi:diaminohydroxyphosphoribosylaminopyrimidine deaminase/5-amino-6-(5-phosphoribosylamino)uracil reductase